MSSSFSTYYSSNKAVPNGNATTTNIPIPYSHENGNGKAIQNGNGVNRRGKQDTGIVTSRIVYSPTNGKEAFEYHSNLMSPSSSNEYYPSGYLSPAFQPADGESLQHYESNLGKYKSRFIVWWSLTLIKRISRILRPSRCCELPAGSKSS